MAIAGRVAIVPKGEWVETTSYQKLDLVTHNRNAYIAKKPSTGVVPEDGEIWMLVLENYLQAEVDELSADISAILSGTTQVGNADTVDGYHASDFLPLTGGTLSGELRILQNGSTDYAKTILITANNGVSYILNEHTDGTRRQLGVIPPNNQPDPTKALEFQVSDGETWKQYLVLHTGNKPSGTYTGNGSATTRTINTGGIGNCCLMWGADYSLLVTVMGAIGFNSSISDKVYFPHSTLRFTDGNLIMNGNHSAFNTSGASYAYQVL